MLNFCSLYSGSSGNCSFAQSSKTNILIDAGVSTRKIENALSSIKVSPESISAILVTHEHSDHIQSIGNISSKYNIPIYISDGTWNALSQEQKEKISPENHVSFTVDEKFSIGDLEIFPFSIPHDAADPCGFNIYNGTSKISIATDLGHVTEGIIKNLENSSCILLESNYEPEVLKFSRYPYILKKRIDGPNGHLSNIDAGNTISRLIPTGLNNVLLGHLSKENNFPELAYKTVMEQIVKNNFSDTSINLSVARSQRS
ncbi:MAG: MBL fold metallo-hydrolase [Clostridia bacterium]|nr:MBL fold metallo-hydrolase [Clostridia bacterium]